MGYTQFEATISIIFSEGIVKGISLRCCGKHQATAICVYFYEYGKLSRLCSKCSKTSYFIFKMSRLFSLYSLPSLNNISYFCPSEKSVTQ